MRAKLQMLALMVLCLTQFPMYAATTTATISANIVAPVSLEVENGLVYTAQVGKSVPGSVKLNPEVSGVSVGGVSVDTMSAGKPATFKVQGKPNSTYSIRLPESVVLTDAQGNTLMADRFTSFPAASGITDKFGQQTLSVGARLNVAEDQVQSPYAGQMYIIIEYN
ncbi:MAG: DUF4402 domain-containing protein [Pseudomonadota bacterium]